MIVTCHSCATRYDSPAARFSGRGAMMRCAACRHGWIECRDLDVIDIPTRNQPAMIDVSSDTEREIKRLIDASRAAREAFVAEHRARQRRRRGWAVLAAAVSAPFVLAALFPEQVVRTAPAAARFYEQAGIAVNIYGLEIRKVEQKHMVVDGAHVLAIKGVIVNVSSSDRKVPSLRFILGDQNGNDVYGWTVESNVRPLRPGDMMSFTTRIASPPAEAEAVQIRFARIEEIGSDANP